MFSGSKKPYSAITWQVDSLTSDQYAEDDIGGIPDLVEVIRIQDTGPTEAARALRKKLKYGNPHKQIRALVILDGLIQNAGGRFQRTFADEPLLERLRLLVRDEAVDARVRHRCQTLFTQWANNYRGTAGLERIANLYKEVPKTQRPVAARNKVIRETEPPPIESPFEESPSRSRSNSAAQNAARASSSNPATLTSTQPSFSSRLFKDKKTSSGKGFNLSREKENMTNSIAKASIASTNLLNGLQLINREKHRISSDDEIVRRFETCKSLRRQILYYIQHVESDEWIGSLVNANDELVKALTAYEIMDRSVDDDSDSDEWEGSRHALVSASRAQGQLAGLSLAEAPPTKPPRPNFVPLPPKPASAPKPESEEEDEDNPFGDSNAVQTPGNEPSGLRWKEV